MSETVETIDHAEDEPVQDTRTVTRPPAKKRKTPKAPKDHQPKLERAKVEELPDGKRVTIRDITVEVSTAAINDFEILDDIRAVEVNRDPTRFPGLLRRLLGSEQYTAVLDRLRDKKTGRVTVEAGIEYTGALLRALNPNS